MKRYIWFWLIGLWAWVLGGCGPSFDETWVESLPLHEAVYSSGAVQPVQVYDVYAPVQAVVLEVLVRPGDTVIPGQPLVRLRQEQAGIQVTDAQLRLQRAQERLAPNSPVLQELRQAIQQAQLRFAQDSIDYQRYQTLRTEGATSQSAYEQVRQRFELARATLRAADDRYRSTIDQLSAERDAAQQALALTQSRLEDYTIRASTAGRVLNRMVEPGLLVGPTRPLLRIGSTAGWELQLIIDESDINRVALGQQCLVRLETYPADSIFAARVTKIYPELDPQTNAFRLDATFDRLPAKLFAGTSAEVNIVINQKPQTLVIPKAYLLPGDSVWTAPDGGKPQKQPITTGIGNLDQVEVLSGLQAGQTIYLPK
jgi:multidrug efflux pump subunit AcrA (membrane-fusion protein)